MSDDQDRQGSPLDRLIDEAKNEREPKAVRDLDWSAIEARVMSEVEKAPVVLLPTRRQKILRGATLGLAIAASIVIYIRRQPAEHPLPVAAQPAPSVEVVAAAEASSFTGGELHVGGAVAKPGFTVHEGDALSVAHGRALLERAGAVAWLVEPEDQGAGDGVAARARVTSAGKPLVLSLEHGAIEAQVVPVEEGEAFAVDVATTNSVVRVAVHGTHLRVSRAGDRVYVDLTEGVIAIGIRPKSGLTTGTTVTAPAHVELDARDLGTLRVDHAPAAVRKAIPLGPNAATGIATAIALTPPEPKPAPSTKLGPAIPPPKAPPMSARDTIVAAVRQCASRHAKSDAVRVTVTSNLSLTVSPTGAVELVKFDPPLPPDVQSCAADTIYKTTMDETGMVAVPLEFSY